MTVPMSNPNGSTTAQTIRTARAEAANDIAKSRLRLAAHSAVFRAEAVQLATLMAIGELIGVTDVEAKQPDVVDAAVSDG
jgi:hypothetical protein